MGYKCPICFKDFGIDKSAWEKHIAKEHGGVGEMIVGITVETAEGTTIEAYKKPTEYLSNEWEKKENGEEGIGY